MKKFKKGDAVRHLKTDRVYVILVTPEDGLRLEHNDQPAYCYRELTVVDYVLPCWVQEASEMEDGRFILAEDVMDSSFQPEHRKNGERKFRSVEESISL